MTSPIWEYFGRRGAMSKVTELYRMPAGTLPPLARFAAKQRLRKGLFWLDAGDDNALANDWASGWFDFDDDKLTEAEANAIVAEWAASDNWPGRP